MSFTGNETHKILLSEAKEMTAAYRATMTAADIKGGYFSKSEILGLLRQDDCVGFRYYYGIDNGQKVLVLVGADRDENDLVTGIILERAIPCPNQCSEDNDLNS